MAATDDNKTGGKCQCRICKTYHALDEIDGRGLGVDEQVALIRSALDEHHEESFGWQMTIDAIAERLGIEGAKGTTESRVIEQIDGLKDQMADLEDKLAEAVGLLTALRLVPFEYCMISGEHDPTHSPRRVCIYQYQDYARKVLFLLHGVDFRNPTNTQLNRVPRIAGRQGEAWLDYPEEEPRRSILEWIEHGVQVSGSNGAAS